MATPCARRIARSLLPRKGAAISYASEWLLDNFYVVEQALDEVEQDMPGGFYRKLPRLGAAAPLPGYPRVYALAYAYLAREDYQVDADRLVRFVLAYQRTQPLTLSEVWALPVMLRLVLLEVLTIGAAHMTQTPGSAGTLEMLEPRFQSIITSPEGGASLEDTVASAIPSLRQLDVYDWLQFSEQISVVHRQLEEDPAGVYPYMDFDTRNRYRSEIEELAIGAALTELEVTRATVALAAETAGVPAETAGVPAEQPPQQSLPRPEDPLADPGAWRSRPPKISRSSARSTPRLSRGLLFDRPGTAPT